MKKILSIILALTLMMGLIPTAFADDTAPETTSVTFNFTSNGHSVSSNDRMEHTNGTKYYTELNSNPEKGGAWAYLGTTTNLRNNDDSRIVYIGTDRSQVYLAEDTYMAFKIRVPESGTYKIEEYKPYLIRNSTATDIKMYIVPMDETLGAKLDANTGTAWTDSADFKGINRTNPLKFSQLGITASPLGTYSSASTSTGVVAVDVDDFGVVENMEANSDYALILHSENGGRMGITSLTLSKIIPEPVVSFDQTTYQTYDDGTIELNSSFSLSGEEITNIAPVYSVTDEKIATISGNLLTGVAGGETTVTVTYIYNEKEYSATATVKVTEPDKKHAFYFGTKYMTAAAKEVAGITDDNPQTNDMSFVNTYEKIAIDTTNTHSWAVETLLNKCNEVTLKSNAFEITALKSAYDTDYNGSRFVLKTNIEYNGTYDMTARIATKGNGAEANVYMLPANNSINEITSAMLKNYSPVGRVDGDSTYTGGNVQSVGEVDLVKGDYYIVFDFNSARPTTGNSDGGNQIFEIRYIILNETESTEEALQTTAVSAPTIAITSNLPGAEIKIETLDSVGASYTLNAPDEEGYTFLGWKRGVAKADGESYIETDGTAKFTDYKQNDIIKVYTNTFLTAVYEKNEPAATENPIIKFWNQDKSFLGAIAKDDITTLPVVSLIGHSFKGWFTSPGKALVLDDVTVDTNAVASYEENSYLDADNAYDKVRVNGEDVSESKYGEAVVCEDNNGIVTHWLRDGKIVSYDKKYTHYIWDGTVISSSYAPVEKKPLVVLENTTIDGASMIEYDGAGKEIVEVGILFGEAGSTPVVGSTFDKYVSQRSDNHGQLAAKPINDSYTVARGYMIYIDGGKTYVIYSE
ncbi:MAG: hypothetical protein E7441_11240 [Ruminococcaceae bacterium]|nr:hypothetical protein [Oscillospiraceae bacterium]